MSPCNIGSSSLGNLVAVDSLAAGQGVMLKRRCFLTFKRQSNCALSARAWSCMTRSSVAVSDFKRDSCLVQFSIQSTGLCTLQADRCCLHQCRQCDRQSEMSCSFLAVICLAATLIGEGIARLIKHWKRTLRAKIESSLSSSACCSWSKASSSVRSMMAN